MKQISIATILVAVMLLPVMMHAQNVNQKNKKKEANMDQYVKNKEAVRRLYEELLNKKNLSILSEIISPDYRGIAGKKGAAAFAEPITALINAFPDIQWKIEDLVAEGDKVMIRWKWQGTHSGQFLQYAATGNSVTNEGSGTYVFRNGKVIGTQVQTDRLGFLQQLNVLPVDLTVLKNRKSYKGRVNFIDKFFIPADAKKTFIERMNINRSFIKTLPGFIEDAAYERTDEKGNAIIITVAVWKDAEAMAKAKDAVQAEYKKQGFNPAEMMERLHITMDRGVYTEAEN